VMRVHCLCENHYRCERRGAPFTAAG
jgi:hypothetical protein